MSFRQPRSALSPPCGFPQKRISQKRISPLPFLWTSLLAVAFLGATDMFMIYNTCIARFCKMNHYYYCDIEFRRTRLLFTDSAGSSFLRCLTGDVNWILMNHRKPSCEVLTFYLRDFRGKMFVDDICDCDAGSDIDVDFTGGGTLVCTPGVCRWTGPVDGLLVTGDGL